MYLILLSVKQGGIKYHFWVFGMTRPRIETQAPQPLVNTLLIRPKWNINKKYKINKSDHEKDLKKMQKDSSKAAFFIYKNIDLHLMF